MKIHNNILYPQYQEPFMPQNICAELTYFGTGFCFYNVLKDCICHHPIGRASIVRGVKFGKFIENASYLILLAIVSLINYFLVPHHAIQQPQTISQLLLYEMYRGQIFEYFCSSVILQLKKILLLIKLTSKIILYL